MTQTPYYKKNDILNDSVNDLIKEGTIESIVGKDFYNYVLIDGGKFFKILQKYNFNILEISKEDFKLLKKCCFYVGKGRNGRKYNHLSNCKELFKNKMQFRRICAKFSKIARIWDAGNGIICLHLFHETSHYMAHNREFSIIKALGINNLTNSINGSCYGDMKNSWNSNEIVNFGNMLLYNAFKMLEPPSVIYHEDVLYKYRTCNKQEKDIELMAILDYFLDL